MVFFHGDRAGGAGGGEELVAAQARFGSASSPQRLMSGFGSRLFVVSGGRWGRLAIAPRRWREAVGASHELGRAAGQVSDRWSTRTVPVTASTVTGFGVTFEHGLRARLEPARARVRAGVVRAGSMLGLVALDLVMVVAVVFTVDLMLNLPLVARLARGAGETEVHVAAAGTALLLVLVGHWTVRDVPPGLRARARTRLVVALVAALGVFVVTGSFLRGRNPGGSSTTTPPLNPGQAGSGGFGAGLSALIGPGTVVVAGIALLVMTWAVSALASLGRAVAVDRLTADNPRARIAAVRAEAWDRSVAHLVKHAHALTGQLADAHLAGFTTTAHPDLADRTRPYPLPDSGPADPPAPFELTA